MGGARELGSLRVRSFRGGCTARGEGVLALQAAALGQRRTGGAGAEQEGASVARARARGGERARGLWRGGEAVQERRACGSGEAAQEWRRRSGVRARGAGRQFRGEEEEQE